MKGKGQTWEWPILRKDFRYDIHAVAVPKVVYDFLCQKYGVDVDVKREINRFCPDWTTELRSRYVYMYEECGVLEMVKREEEKDHIEIIMEDGQTAQIY